MNSLLIFMDVLPVNINSTMGSISIIAIIIRGHHYPPLVMCGRSVASASGAPPEGL
jgi:hypothetical protein